MGTVGAAPSPINISQVLQMLRQFPTLIRARLPGERMPPRRTRYRSHLQRSELKIGRPFAWIRTAIDQTVCCQQDFYRHCEIVPQPSDTTENWLRVGLEAMASGSVLVVDNRGGWRGQVDHGVTGWLCNNERKFIYYASKMAYESDLRLEMAERGRQRVTAIAGLAVAQESWEAVFKLIM
ncbi:MAG: hypothetical protein JWO52_6946 [Gammaproteobacteria bacterium]|jgi:hypothetical protein|nr:hypothetical protein [Gammaproteobacteria bacterium]